MDRRCRCRSGARSRTGCGTSSASGALRPGDPLPSVRDLAREQRINPNTVAKAYQRLVEAGVLETRRGEGTFVAERPPALPAGEKERVLREAASRYASFASTVGASRPEAFAALQQAWPDGEPGGQGRTGDERASRAVRTTSRSRRDRGAGGPLRPHARPRGREPLRPARAASSRSSAETAPASPRSCACCSASARRRAAPCACSARTRGARAPG